jgi:hypothetical protein
MDLSSQAHTLSQMFTQVSSSVQSEITAINVRERQRDDGRQKWNAFAATTLSIMGVSVGFVIAFLGINTAEVPGPPSRPLSMWDGRFATLYLVAALFALTPAYFICLPYLRDWIKPKHHNDIRALVLGAIVSAAGAGVLVWAVDRSRHGPARDFVVDSIEEALAWFTLAVGVSFVVFWIWYRVKMILDQRRAPAAGATSAPVITRGPATP